jgi:O-antigen ligase
MESSKLYKYLGLILGAIIIVPFKMKPFLILFLFVSSLISFFKEKKNKSRLNFKNVFFLSFVLIPYLISIFYSSNTTRAFEYFFRSIPMLIIPLSFTLMENNSRSIFLKWFLKSFIITNVIYILAMLIYIMHLGYLFLDNDLNYYYSYITNEFYKIGDHPIYLSVQFVMAIFFLIFIKSFNKNQKAFLFIILIFGLFFLSRKGVIISFIITLTFYLYSIYKFKINFITTVSIILFAFLMSILSPQIRSRYSEVFDKTKLINNEETSTGIRVILWKNTIELIRESFLLGYGIGDTQEILSTKIEKKGFYKIAAKKSNCHNQYLQFTLSIGLVGLTFFISSILHHFYFFYRKRLYFGISILSFFLFVFISESFLDRQNGIIIYSLFTSILVVCNKSLKEERL